MMEDFATLTDRVAKLEIRLEKMDVTDAPPITFTDDRTVVGGVIIGNVPEDYDALRQSLGLSIDGKPSRWLTTRRLAYALMQFFKLNHSVCDVNCDLQALARPPAVHSELTLHTAFGKWCAKGVTAAAKKAIRDYESAILFIGHPRSPEMIEARLLEIPGVMVESSTIQVAKSTIYLESGDCDMVRMICSNDLARFITLCSPFLKTFSVGNVVVVTNKGSDAVVALCLGMGNVVIHDARK